MIVNDVRQAVVSKKPYIIYALFLLILLVAVGWGCYERWSGLDSEKTARQYEHERDSIQGLRMVEVLRRDSINKALIESNKRYSDLLNSVDTIFVEAEQITRKYEAKYTISDTTSIVVLLRRFPNRIAQVDL